MSTIKIDLTLEEVNYVVKVLNNLPTETNAWPLVQKIRQQASVSHVTPEEVKPE